MRYARSFQVACLGCLKQCRLHRPDFLIQPTDERACDAALRPITPIPLFRRPSRLQRRQSLFEWRTGKQPPENQQHRHSPVGKIKSFDRWQPALE